MPSKLARQNRGTDGIWIASAVSLILVITSSFAITWWTSGNKPDTQHADAHNHHGIGHDASAQSSHSDFFTNSGLYMPRTHCLINEAGQPDWPWIITLIVLSLTVIAAYVRIYLFWCKSYFAEEARDRNPRLMDLAQIFLWCAVCGYATSVLMFFWPAYRLVAVCLLFLAFWSWRFCLNLSGFRAAFTSNRYRRLLHQDKLTGLASRVGIYETLRQCLESDDASPRAVALLFLDFDRFKLVNDSMGHDAGDELLKQIAERLHQAVHAQASDPAVTYHAGRLGGDEFVIIIEGTDDQATAEALADHLQEKLTHAYTIDGRAVNSSVSIGITSTQIGFTTVDTILRDADIAMYEAKRAGRGRNMWFNQAMHDRVKEAVELEHDLKQAIDNDELFLVYQPLIDLESGRVTGFEALIRWKHPVRGLIAPDRFIPIAEESLLIQPIGRWVILEALKQAKAWRQQFPELADHVMNVNLSRIQFADPQLTAYIIETLRELDLPANALCLEITESTIMEDSSQSIALLQRIKDHGIKLAMDDFGTGYSSLSLLHAFPIDSLKIDKSFISNLENNRPYAAVIHAITALANNLGYTVVGEGIETRDQLIELQALSVHEGQGYFFKKPAEPGDIEAYLSDRQAQAQPV